MIHLDGAAVLDLLDKAAAERGEEYKYVQPLVDIEEMASDIYGNLQVKTHKVKRCVYVDSSTGERRPSCLVGMALYLAGVPLEQLDVSFNTTSTHLLNQLGNAGALTVSVEVYEILRNAQMQQDSGCSWGVVAAGERNAAEKLVRAPRD